MSQDDRTGWESPRDISNRKGIPPLTEDDIMRSVVMRGWHGGFVETWLSAEFWKIVAE